VDLRFAFTHHSSGDLQFAIELSTYFWRNMKHVFYATRDLKPEGAAPIKKGEVALTLESELPLAAAIAATQNGCATTDTPASDTPATDKPSK
jgi:hypothetical protein